MAEARAALGFAAHIGWAAVVAVAGTRETIQCAYSMRIETCDPQDREAREPYHLAGGYDGLQRVTSPSDPAATVARGLSRQRRHTRQALQTLLHTLAGNGVRPIMGAVLAGRGRIGHDLTRLLASHAQIHIAEGDAVRESIQRSLSSLGLAAVYIDRHDLEDAQEVAGIARAQLEERLQRMTPINRGSWRKEERLCALAAWSALFDPKA